MTGEAAISLREKAQQAWAEQRAQQEREHREWLDATRQIWRCGLRDSIASSLRVSVDPRSITCPVSDDQIGWGPTDGTVLAETEVDGLRLALVQRGNSTQLRLLWACPSCGVAPITDSHVTDLAKLGSLLEHLPTLCRCSRNEEVGF